MVPVGSPLRHQRQPGAAAADAAVVLPMVPLDALSPPSSAPLPVPYGAWMGVSAGPVMLPPWLIPPQHQAGFGGDGASGQLRDLGGVP